MKTALWGVARSPVFWMAAAGYMLRVAMMPLTGQHDVMFMPWMAHYITHGHFNLYGYLYERFGPVVMHSPGVWAAYPYGFYLWTAGWIGFLDWIGLVDISSWESIWEVGQRARYVFLFKTAYLPFDLAIAYVLYRTWGKSGLILWAWSPTALYTAFMMGQNDIYATAFAVMGTFAAAKALQGAAQDRASPGGLRRRWALVACILLGVGSIFKVFPLILLPPLALVIEKQWWRRVALVGVGCSIYAAASLPFLTTPAFVNGVLLNPEGTQIFREIHLFGVGVSPFLLGYFLLLGYLALDPAPRTPVTAWLASLMTLALLFLWVPAPFYWLIWVTPFLIGAASGAPPLLLAWFMLQLAFALTLPSQHRELGVALPIHLAPMTNMPNLPTALALTHPALYRLYVTLLTVSPTLQVAALGVAVWFAARMLAQPCQTQAGPLRLRPHGWIGAAIPVAVMLVMLGANLFLARNFVSDNNRYSWQNQTVTGGEPIVQELEWGPGPITGLRLRVGDADPAAQVTACLYRSRDLSQAPLACASRGVAEQVENQMLYFVFENPVVLGTHDAPTARIQLAENGAAMVTLPYTTFVARALHFGETQVAGSLDIVALSPFSLAAAWQRLVVENILQDGWLMAALAVVSGLIGLFLAVLLSRPYPPAHSVTATR